MGRPTRQSPPRVHWLVAGVITAAAGGLVAVGSPLPIAIAASLPGETGFAAMQLDEALAFAACGLALVLAAARGRQGLLAVVAVALATAAALVALLNLLPLLPLLPSGFVGDLGIERALGAWLPAGAASPGRMAPGAALGLLLVGVGLSAAPRLPVAACALGAIAAALGVSALLGNATGVGPAHPWSAWTRMTPASAVCLLVAGSALARLRPADPARAALTPWRAPALAGLSTAVATVLVCQALAIREQQHFELLLEEGANRVQAAIRARLDARMEALAILARQWPGRFLRTRGSWESDVRLVLSQSPGLAAIEWIEFDGDVDWVHPREVVLPPPALGRLARGGAASGPVAIGPFRFPDGKRGFRILAPRVKGSDLMGWLSGAFRSDVLFADVLSRLAGDLAVRVSSGGVSLYGVEPAEGEARFARERELALPGGMKLAVLVHPSAAMLAARTSFVPALLAAGLGLSALLALALGFANVARERAVTLESEVAAHARAAQEVRRLNVELEARVGLRTEALARSNEDLQRFAAFLSHELRQPVGAQAIWAELLEAGYAERLDEDGRRYLARIRSNSQRMADLIAAQLELFSASAGDLKQERVDLQMLVQGLVAELKPSLEMARGHVEPRDLPVVLGDPQMLHQLFRNLLENSIKCARRDKPLEVRIRRVPPGSDATDSLEIRFEDNGRGFAQADAERIFLPRVRLDSGHGGGGGGHGLGLTVCRRIVERHGGSLSARGQPDAGATFIIRWPDAICGEPPAPPV